MMDLPTRCRVAFSVTPEQMNRAEETRVASSELPRVQGLRALGMLELGVLRKVVSEDRREDFVRDIVEGRPAVVEVRLDNDAGWLYAFVHPPEGDG